MITKTLKLYLRGMDWLGKHLNFLEKKVAKGMELKELIWAPAMWTFGVFCVAVMLGPWFICGFIPSIAVYQIAILASASNGQAMDLAVVAFIVIGLPIMILLKKKVRQIQGLGY